MNIHPLADAFPMMTEDELADLAFDIKENGQIHPIIVDADGTLIDGRNRLRACEIAGVEPTFAPLNGHDVAAFIVSTNIARRNLSKGQQAIALALLYPEPAKLKRSGAGSLDSKEHGISAAHLSQARAILRHSVGLAHDVRDGREHFDQALTRVKTAEQFSKSREAQLAELRAKAPDVAALVSDDRLTLEAGLAELSQRQRLVRKCIEDGRESVRQFVGLAPHLTVIETAAALTEADLALIGLGLEDADPLAELSEKELEGLVLAVCGLQEMKRGKRHG